MRTKTSVSSRALPALLAAAVVSIVLGIMGMHALNTHGVTDLADHAAMTIPAGGAHTDMSVPPAISDLGGVAVAPSTTDPNEGDASHLGGMVMLCLALLAATAGALLLVLLGSCRIPRVWARLPAAPTTLIRWVTARLGTGPPPDWEFSVVRC